MGEVDIQLTYAQPRKAELVLSKVEHAADLLPISSGRVVKPYARIISAFPQSFSAAI